MNQKSIKGKTLKKPLITGLAILLLFMAGGLLVARKVYTNNLRPVSAVESSQTVTIPTGTSVKGIGQILENAGLIREAWAFEWYVRSAGLRDKMQAGTYSISPSQSTAQISKLLTSGQEKTDQVTFLPAKRLDELRSALINSGFSVEEVDAALNPALYVDHPALSDKPAEANLEGYLYPDTYLKTGNTTAEQVIRLSLDEMHGHLTPEIRDGIKQQGLTVHQGVILASIIDREVSDPEAKKKVAQVFLRRLREGIRLESDPTALYGAALAGAPPSLHFESAYNTYKNDGLTPTPIGNVTKAALQAVASPAPGSFLFFVAGEDGKTHFSSTIAEHEANIRQYCRKCVQP